MKGFIHRFKADEDTIETHIGNHYDQDFIVILKTSPQMAGILYDHIPKRRKKYKEKTTVQLSMIAIVSDESFDAIHKIIREDIPVADESQKK